MTFNRILPGLSLLGMAALPAHAASSDWHHVQGGAVRIVTEQAADAHGILRGALEIQLNPGWKTYWLDPGASGVPPQIAISVDGHDTPVRVEFPAPQRFDDGYAQWTGYDAPVSFALTLKLPEGVGATPDVTVNAFLGVCETICIPVQADLSLSLGKASAPIEDEMTVKAAFDALPAPADGAITAKFVREEERALVIEASLPEGVEAKDLFVAGNDVLQLEASEPVVNAADGTLFRLPISWRAKDAVAESLRYTLLTSEGAVSGELTLR